jgi:uncharacterized protein with GYD domain
MNKGGWTMKTFVLVTKLTAPDARCLEIGSKHRNHERSGRMWLKKVQEQCPEVEFIAHYALMGYWDSMHIYNTPDEETAARVSMITKACGAEQVETWLALPFERVLQISDEIGSASEEE